jgi:transglutaminase-like putative cysteine protease
VFLLGSRYRDTEKLSETAWSLFAKALMGWRRVRAICDFAHNHISFGYEHARATRTAWEGFSERRGVCRDYADLAVAFCRCLNIPARYCTGYLGDIECRHPMARWISLHGSRHISEGVGTPSTPAITCPGSDGC